MGRYPKALTREANVNYARDFNMFATRLLFTLTHSTSRKMDFLILLDFGVVFWHLLGLGCEHISIMQSFCYCWSTGNTDKMTNFCQLKCVLVAHKCDDHAYSVALFIIHWLVLITVHLNDKST